MRGRVQERRKMLLVLLKNSGEDFPTFIYEEGKMQTQQIGSSTQISCSPGSKHKTDIIWNTTMICPWNCLFCCVDAIHVTGSRNHAFIASRDLQRHETILLKPGENRFDAALRHLQANGRELSWGGKLSVLDHLSGEDVRLDISGGDALVITEGKSLLAEASRRLGKANVTLTATGAGMRKSDIPEVASIIGEFNFSYDGFDSNSGQMRPPGYAKSNLHLGQQIASLGVSVRAELPLTREIATREALEEIYATLSVGGVQRLLIMRLFAVGRGSHSRQSIPTTEEYKRAIEILFNCEQRSGGPEVRLQCALRHLVSNKFGEHDLNPCDLVRESYGLMADGTLLASPWAIGATGEPLDPAFVLGNLAKTPLGELRNCEFATEIRRRADENHGHCKVVAFQHSKRRDPIDRMVDPADPLYSTEAFGTSDARMTQGPSALARCLMGAGSENGRPVCNVGAQT